jgi:Ca2+-binding EF-hand superfamily protein
MLAVLSPQNDTDECSDETPSDRKLDGCLDFARIVERMTLNRLYPGNNPQEAFTESCPSRESEIAHEQPLDSHTGLIFCEEMLRHCHGEAGFEDAYRAMDLDSDGSVSVNEFVTAVRKFTLSLRLPELVRVHQHLEKCENLSNDLSPTHFCERTKTLTAKYRKGGKLAKYCSDMERISAAEKYFISRSLKIKS